jgi:hypothetical protein
LHPVGDRTYFHLIYATRSPKGVETFKGVEKAAFHFQQRVRVEAEERAQVRRSGQLSLFGGEEQPPSHRAILLRERYTAEARQAVETMIMSQPQTPNEVAWDAAMRLPLVWESDLKEWITALKDRGRITIDGLKPRAKVPQRDQGHVLVRR